jgi:hypothetical protein
VINTLRCGTSTDTFVTEKAGKLGYVKKTKYQQLQKAHENSRKIYGRKAGKTLKTPVPTSIRT